MKSIIESDPKSQKIMMMRLSYEMRPFKPLFRKLTIYTYV